MQGSNTIVLSPEANELLQNVKQMFKEVTDNDDMSDEDVVITLLAGFVDGMRQQQGGCCSSEAGCCGDEEGACCSEDGSCSGNCAC